MTHDSIIITKPDEGNGVVIKSRLDYLKKMKYLISDKTKFKELKHNPTKSREDSLSAYLRKLRNDKIRILPSGYGLPKVHKTGRFYARGVNVVSDVKTVSRQL